MWAIAPCANDPPGFNNGTRLESSQRDGAGGEGRSGIEDK